MLLEQGVFGTDAHLKTKEFGGIQKFSLNERTPLCREMITVITVIRNVYLESDSDMHASIKTHHLLDFMYEMTAFHGKFETVTPNGSNYGYCGSLIAAGKIDIVNFTAGADDP